MRDVFVMVIYFKNNFLKGDIGSTDMRTLQKYSFFKATKDFYEKTYISFCLAVVSGKSTNPNSV